MRSNQKSSPCAVKLICPRDTVHNVKMSMLGSKRKAAIWTRFTFYVNK